MRPVTARVNTANPVAYVRLDESHGAALAVQAVIEAGGGGGGVTPSYVQGGYEPGWRNPSGQCDNPDRARWRRPYRVR